MLQRLDCSRECNILQMAVVSNDKIVPSNVVPYLCKLFGILTLRKSVRGTIYDVSEDALV